MREQDYSLCGAKANVDGEKKGSNLTIEGEGNLDAQCKSGYDGAGIGGKYASSPVSNITINSGNITAIGRNSGCGIGGGLRQKVNNIIINGGNITATGGNRFGIGSYIVDNIVINGGNIIATGGEYGGAIGGYDGSGKITINGGVIQSKTNYKYSAIGNECSEVEITGGTIIVNAPKFAGISCNSLGTIKITGGSILANGTIAIGEIDENNILTETIPTDGTNNLYLTLIQLEDVTEKIKISNITTSDNKNYGIKDMYTSEDGILYLYLPEGSRTITVETNEKKYEGTVVTSQSNSLVMLEKK